MTTKNAYVPLWLTYGTYFESYSDEQVGRITRAMMEYRRTGAAPKFEGSEKYIWPAIKRDIDNLVRTLQERSEQNRLNGMKGGRPRKPQEESVPVPTESARVSTEAKKGNETVNDTVNESAKDTVSAKDSEIVKKKENDLSAENTAAAYLSPPDAQKTQARVEGGADAREKKILFQLGDYFEKSCRQKRTGLLEKSFRESLRDGVSEALLREAVDVTAASAPEKPVFYICSMLERLREEKVRDVDAFRARQKAFRRQNAPNLRRDQMFDYTSEEGSL